MKWKGRPSAGSRWAAIQEWHPRFAWAPVRIGDHWHWMERVDRRYVVECETWAGHIGRWEYRLPC